MGDLKYKLMSKIEDASENEDGINVYDPTDIKWQDFAYTNGFYKHKLSKNEIYKPYLLSSAYFGTVIYENIILLINGIEDIWNVPVGTEIRIPKEEDIKQFIKVNAV